MRRGSNKSWVIKSQKLKFLSVVRGQIGVRWRKIKSTMFFRKDGLELRPTGENRDGAVREKYGQFKIIVCDPPSTCENLTYIRVALKKLDTQRGRPSVEKGFFPRYQHSISSSMLHIRDGS